jgi:hypothetical protein
MIITHFIHNFLTKGDIIIVIVIVIVVVIITRIRTKVQIIFHF